VGDKESLLVGLRVGNRVGVVVPSDSEVKAIVGLDEEVSDGHLYAAVITRSSTPAL